MNFQLASNWLPTAFQAVFGVFQLPSNCLPTGFQLASNWCVPTPLPLGRGVGTTLSAAEDLALSLHQSLGRLGGGSFPARNVYGEGERVSFAVAGGGEGATPAPVQHPRATHRCDRARGITSEHRR